MKSLLLTRRRETVKKPSLKIVECLFIEWMHDQIMFVHLEP